MAKKKLSTSKRRFSQDGAPIRLLPAEKPKSGPHNVIDVRLPKDRIIIGPIGQQAGRIIRAEFTKTGIRVAAGCFSGTPNELAKKVKEVYRSGNWYADKRNYLRRYREEYLATAEFLAKLEKIWYAKKRKGE